MPALDNQIGGNHYKLNAIQPIQYTVANAMGPCEMNIIKYITRFQHKNGVEDLKKARHYIELHLETIQSEPLAFRALRELISDTFSYAITPTAYCNANGISDGRVRYIIHVVSTWRRSDFKNSDLDEALHFIDSLIKEFDDSSPVS